MTATPTPLRELLAEWREAEQRYAELHERLPSLGYDSSRATIHQCIVGLEAALSARDEAGAVDVAEIRNVAGELRDWRGRQGQPSHTLFSLAERLDDAIATPPASGEAGAGVRVCTFADCTCDALHTTTSGEPIDPDPPADACDADRLAQRVEYQAKQIDRGMPNAKALRDIATAIRRLAAVAPAGMDGMAMVPRHLTAENGAKAALIGEFSFRDGSGREHDVPWHVIKQIHRRVVETFAAPTPPATAGKE